MTLPHWAQAILDALNNPFVKAGMVFLGTAILRAIPTFVNEAVPFWTGLYAVITAALAALFPQHAGELHTASVAAFVVASGPLWYQSLLSQIVFQGIIPWAMGFAGQRGVAQTHAFVTGAPVIPDSGPPIARAPFQSTVRR